MRSAELLGNLAGAERHWIVPYGLLPQRKVRGAFEDATIATQTAATCV